MGRVGGPSLIKIKAINRLMRATDTFGAHSSVMESQIQRTRERLNLGIDVNGASFAPYKEDRPTNQERPLARAARLFDDVRYTYNRTLEGFDIIATITGQAAKIAHYQNVKRRFIGYSAEDRRSIKQGVAAMLKEAMRNAR